MSKSEAPGSDSQEYWAEQVALGWGKQGHKVWVGGKRMRDLTWEELGDRRWILLWETLEELNKNIKEFKC